MSQGTKFDKGKNRIELVPPEIIEGIAQVLTFGAGKYGDFNWRKGLEYSRVVGALLRHIFAYMRGEREDPETGLSHLQHAACNLAFLVTFETYPKEFSRFNNLPAYQKVKEPQEQEEKPGLTPCKGAKFLDCWIEPWQKQSKDDHGE